MSTIDTAAIVKLKKDELRETTHPKLALASEEIRKHQYYIELTDKELSSYLRTCSEKQIASYVFDRECLNPNYFTWKSFPYFFRVSDTFKDYFSFCFLYFDCYDLPVLGKKDFKLQCAEFEFKLVMEGDNCIIQSYTVYEGKSELEPVNSYKSIDEFVKDAFSLFATSAINNKKWWVTNKDLFENPVTLTYLLPNRKIFKKMVEAAIAIETVETPALARISALTEALSNTKDLDEKQKPNLRLDKLASELAVRSSEIDDKFELPQMYTFLSQTKFESELSFSLLGLSNADKIHISSLMQTTAHREKARIKKMEEIAAKEKAAKEKAIQIKEARDREIQEKVAKKRAAKEKEAKEFSEKIINAVQKNDIKQLASLIKKDTDLSQIKNSENQSLLQIASRNKNYDIQKLLLLNGVPPEPGCEIMGVTASLYLEIYENLQAYLSKLSKVPVKQQKKGRLDVVQFLNPKVSSETLKRKQNAKERDSIILTNSILSFDFDYETRMLAALIARYQNGDCLSDENIEDCLLHESIEFKDALAKKAEEASNKVDALKMARTSLDELFKKSLEECSKNLETISLDSRRKEAIKERANKIVQTQENFQDSLKKFSANLPQFARKIDKIERFLKEAIKKSERSEKLPEDLTVFIKDITAKQVEVASHIETFNHTKIEEYERVATELLAEFGEKCRVYSNSVEELSSLALECKSLTRELLDEIKEYSKENEKQHKRAKADKDKEDSTRSLSASQESPEKSDQSKKDDTWHGGKAARREHFESEQKQAIEEKEARERKEAEDRIRNEQSGKSQRTLHFAFKQGLSKAPEAPTLDSRGQISGKVFFAENLKVMENILKSTIFKPNSEKNHARFKAERHALLGTFGQMIEILKVLYNKNTLMFEAFNHIRNVIFHSNNIIPPILDTSSLKDVQNDNNRIIEMAINTLAFLNDLKNDVTSVPKVKHFLLNKIKSKLLHAMDQDDIPEIDLDECLNQIEFGANDLADYCVIESEENRKTKESSEISELLEIARGFSVTQIGTYAAEIKRLDFKYFTDSLPNKIKLDRDLEWFIEQGKDFRHIRKMDLGGKSESKKHHSAKSESAKSLASKNGKQKGKQQIKKKVFS